MTRRTIRRLVALALVAILLGAIAAGWLLDDRRPIVAGVVGLAVLAGAWLLRWRARRRRRRRRPPPREHIPTTVRQKIYRRDGYACRYCGRKRSPSVRLELDHFVPVARGGIDHPNNLVTACFDCNRAKGARLLMNETALRRFIDERETAVRALTRAERLRALRRDLLATVLVLVLVLATYLVLSRYVW